MRRPYQDSLRQDLNGMTGAQGVGLALLEFALYSHLDLPSIGAWPRYAQDCHPYAHLRLHQPQKIIEDTSYTRAHTAWAIYPIPTCLPAYLLDVARSGSE